MSTKFWCKMIYILKEPTKLKNRPICVDRNWYQPHSYQPLYFIASTIFLIRSGKSLDDETTTTGNAQEEQQLQPQQQTSKEILNLQYSHNYLYKIIVWSNFFFIFFFSSPFSIGLSFLFSLIFRVCTYYTFIVLTIWIFLQICAMHASILEKNVLYWNWLCLYVYLYFPKEEGRISRRCLLCLLGIQ